MCRVAEPPGTLPDSPALLASDLGFWFFSASSISGERFALLSSFWEVTAIRKGPSGFWSWRPGGAPLCCLDAAK